MQHNQKDWFIKKGYEIEETESMLITSYDGHIRICVK